MNNSGVQPPSKTAGLVRRRGVVPRPPWRPPCRSASTRSDARLRWRPIHRP